MLHQAFSHLLAAPVSHFLPSALTSKLPSSLSLLWDSSEILSRKGCSSMARSRFLADYQGSHRPHTAASPSPAQPEDAAGHFSNTQGKFGSHSQPQRQEISGSAGCTDQQISRSASLHHWGVVLMHVHTLSSAEQAVHQPFPQAWAGHPPAQSSHGLLQALQQIE